MNIVAEYVSEGHVDRLCDAICENIVDLAVSKDKDSLVGVEAAIHRDKVFVDGRIACGFPKCLVSENEIIEQVKKAYEEAGYNKEWNPSSEQLEIISDIILDPLNDDERQFRNYSDDQNIVNGYATNIKAANYLPVEHFLVAFIGKEFNKRRKEKYSKIIGPDFKILLELTKIDQEYKINRLTMSVWNKNIDYTSLKNIIFQELKEILSTFSSNYYDSLHFDNSFTITQLFFNGAGDYFIGGPYSDNGLSGKKLALDYYGPNIPIGGGAICGKDPHKVDVAGAFKARELAIFLIKNYGYEEVFTQLAYSPGEQTPHLIEAYSIDSHGIKSPIPSNLIRPKDTYSIACINNDLNLGQASKKSLMKKGYMFI